MAARLREVRTTGAWEGKDCTLGSIKFKRGRAAFYMSDKDFKGFLKYHQRCWGIVEAEDHGGGDDQVHEELRAVPERRGDVPEDEGAPAEAPVQRGGDVGPEAGQEELEALGDRPTSPDLALIKEAVEGLDAKTDEHWTSDGKPRVDVVSERLKRSVSRADLDRLGLSRPEKEE